jgi:hypothetical protein
MESCVRCNKPVPDEEAAEMRTILGDRLAEVDEGEEWKGGSEQ